MAELGVNHGCVCKPNRVHEGRMKMGFVNSHNTTRGELSNWNVDLRCNA